MTRNIVVYFWRGQMVCTRYHQSRSGGQTKPQRPATLSSSLRKRTTVYIGSSEVVTEWNCIPDDVHEIRRSMVHRSGPQSKSFHR